MNKKTTPKMINLVYASIATQVFTEQDLIDLLKKSHRNNLSLGITGMLLYKDGNFLQVLEGEEEAVMALYKKIRNDPLHYQVKTVSKGEILERNFGGWEMAFENIDERVSTNHPAYSDFLNEQFDPSAFVDNPSLAHRYLRVFHEISFSSY